MHISFLGRACTCSRQRCCAACRECHVRERQGCGQRLLLRAAPELRRCSALLRRSVIMRPVQLPVEQILDDGEGPARAARWRGRAAAAALAASCSIPNTHWHLSRELHVKAEVGQPLAWLSGTCHAAGRGGLGRADGSRARRLLGVQARIEVGDRLRRGTSSSPCMPAGHVMMHASVKSACRRAHPLAAVLDGCDVVRARRLLLTATTNQYLMPLAGL